VTSPASGDIAAALEPAPFHIRLARAARQMVRWSARPVVTIFALIGTAGPSNGLWAHLYPVVLGIPLVVTALQRRSSVAFRLWSAYILGFLTFRVVRNFAEGNGSGVHYAYVIGLDRAIGLGHVPTTALQSLWYHPGPGSAIDWCLIAVYLSYFALPPLTALVLWASRSRLFGRYVSASLLLYAAAAVVHILLPTAPPWLAAYRGLLPPVHRIANDLFFHRDPRLYDYASHVAEGNPAAAMPSLHMGATCLVALAMWWTGRRLRVPAVLYAFAMVLALVYLGEHYVADALAGVVIAGGAWWAAGRFESAPSRAWRRELEGERCA
jgi:membrane-associated phospholipid phosphatase